MDPRNILKLILVFALLGMVVDGLLTYNKLTDSNVACDAGGGCDIASGSIYSEIAGIPVSVFGFGLSLLVAVVSALALMGQLPVPKGLLAILVLSGLGVLGAIYFIYLMLFVLEAICQWCMVSHLFMASNFILALLGWKKGNKSPSGEKIMAITFIGMVLLLAGCNSGPPSGYYDDFAKCLTDQGAVMYGAYWCSHCKKVKDSFGDSFQYVTYVECDPKGAGGDPDRCLENNVEAYSTFIFADGTRLVGEPTLEQLAQKTGCTLPLAPGG